MQDRFNHETFYSDAKTLNQRLKGFSWNVCVLKTKPKRFLLTLETRILEAPDLSTESVGMLPFLKMTTIQWLWISPEWTRLLQAVVELLFLIFSAHRNHLQCLQCNIRCQRPAWKLEKSRWLHPTCDQWLLWTPQQVQLWSRINMQTLHAVPVSWEPNKVAAECAQLLNAAVKWKNPRQQRRPRGPCQQGDLTVWFSPPRARRPSLFNKIGGDYLCQWTIPSPPSFICGFIIRMGCGQEQDGVSSEEKRLEAAKSSQISSPFH